MKCEQVREWLAFRGTSDLSPEMESQLALHLEECTPCRAEDACTRRTLALLNQHAVPAVHIDVAQIYRRECDRQRRVSRRWRGAAIAGLAAAAMLLLAIAVPRLEWRLERQQLIVRWGAVEFADPPIARTPPPEAQGLEHAKDQVRVLSQLVQGQRDELDAQNARFSRVEDRLNQFQRTLAAGVNRWRSTEQDVAALFGIHMASSKSGDSHE
jgi:hypothetical protein